MSNPDPLERTLKELSEGAESILRSITPASLDLIAEIVENRVQERMRERRTILIRWLIGIAVPVVGGLAIAVYQNRVELNAEVSRVESGIKAVTNDTHTTPPSPSEAESDQLISPTTRSIPAGASERININVTEEGLFLIDVVAKGSFDPYIELYRVDGLTQRSVASDDDGGDGLSSRLVQQLGPGIYELEVSGLFGEAGEVEVSVTQIPVS